MIVEAATPLVWRCCPCYTCNEVEEVDEKPGGVPLCLSSRGGQALKGRRAYRLSLGLA
jgi:hypothetical protein